MKTLDIPSNENVPPVNKQIKYPGLQARLLSTLIDLALSSVVLMPFTWLVAVLIYGNNPPYTVIGPALADVTKRFSHASADFFRSLFMHPRVYEYFVTQHGWVKFLLEQSLQFAAVAALFLGFWILRSATPGKMLLSMKIVDATTLQPPTKKQLIIRFVASILSALPLFFGFIWILFNKRRQGWHDLIAHTVVIKR